MYQWRRPGLASRVCWVRFPLRPQFMITDQEITILSYLIDCIKADPSNFYSFINEVREGTGSPSDEYSELLSEIEEYCETGKKTKRVSIVLNW